MSWGPFANLESGKISESVSGLDPRTEKSQFEGLGLSWTSRLMAFGACFVIGIVLSFVGAIMFITGLTTLFAIFYTVGLCVSLAGSGFLLTFTRQLKLMMKPTRMTVSLVLVACIAMVFVSAFVLGLDSLVIVFAVGSYLSYAWLSLSYIPFARAFVKKLFGGMF